MCHANVQSTVITDFGSGDVFFADQDKTFNLGATFNTNDTPLYYYDPVPWQATQTVQGQLIIPAVDIPEAIVSNAGAGSAAMDAADFMTDTAMTNFASGFWTYFGMGAATTVAPAAAVTPPSGQAAVQEMSTVYIGAPTQAQIVALAPGQPIGAVAVNGSSASGFSAVAGESVKYVTNTSTVQCAGADVVVTGTLFLNNLRVNAGNGGCRLYVTGAVFIQGPITYLGSDPTSNLQISSAEAIIMGIGLTGTSYQSGEAGLENDPEPGSNPLYTRLVYDSRNLELRGQPSVSAYKSWAQDVYYEGSNIGPTVLIDASNTSGAAEVSVSPAGQARTVVNFNHLLLNAPMVHSRYLGNFTGTISSEVAVMALGEFAFSYDPVFSTQGLQILPLITNNADILCASSTASCNPINR
jgi:hypothetical protein